MLQAQSDGRSPLAVRFLAPLLFCAGLLSSATVLAQDDPPASSPSQTGVSETPAIQAAAPATSGAQDLAKQVSNPISSLISLPIQFNWDFNIGPEDDGFRFATNVQPVIPVSITENWNMISRTIVPVVYQDDLFPGAGHQFGLGDILQSLFFSPKEPSALGGLIWGVGPVLLIPTATDDLLGAEKWGAGPTAVVLKQTGPWTYGILANHIWSFAGESNRADVNATFMQPFVSYTTKKA